MSREADARHPLERRMLDLAFVTKLSDDGEPYDSDIEMLFALIVRGTKLYVEAWAAMPDDGSLAALVVDADDLDDPERVTDPNAKAITLLELTLQSVFENVESFFEDGV